MDCASRKKVNSAQCEVIYEVRALEKIRPQSLIKKSFYSKDNKNVKESTLKDVFTEKTTRIEEKYETQEDVLFTRFHSTYLVLFFD